MKARLSNPWFVRSALWLVTIALAVLCLNAGPVFAEPPKSIRLFGKLEIKSSMKSMTQWLEMLERNKQHPFFSDTVKIKNDTWSTLKEKWGKLSPKAQLEAVNLFWNKWPYRQDPEVYKKPDYWAAPYEFYKNSGDCEDYSIIKYFALLELGVPKDAMRIAVVKETIRNIPHAVLVVYLDDDAYVLDNLNNQVLSHSRFKQYDIHYSINELYKWVHLQGK